VKVLVTGANGFVGKHVRHAIVASGKTFIGLGHAVRSEEGSILREPGEQVPMELTDLEALIGRLRAIRPNVVIHAAAYGVQVGQLDWAKSFDSNVVTSLNVVEAAAAAGVARVIHLGTSQEYGTREGVLREDGPLDPQTPYGATKASAFYLCRQRARELGVHWIELRPFLTFGPGEHAEKLFPSLIVPLLRGEVPAMSGGEQVRDVVYIKDLVSGILAAIEAELPAGAAINLGCGEGRTLKSLAEGLLTLFPGGQIAFGARPYREPEVWHQVADTRLCRSLLGWGPSIPMQQALEETVAYYRGALV
jgi:nucleoside-diphosphate-sugar epimerase